MPGGSVYKDHTFNNETAHLTKTAQYIARNFTVQVHEHPQYKTVHIVYISTIQVHEHYKHKKQKIHEKTHNTTKNVYLKNSRKYENNIENTVLL
jgi:hypothetical protein